MKSSTVNFYKRSINTLVLILGLLSFSSCQKKTRPSFIIIAADRLSFNAFSCNEERNAALSGLSILCQESIRYTNAYTTSTQSAAAIGSFLTGSYPYQNSLHRSQDRINPHYPLLQEYFKKANYRTAFFSASPSVMKKTGLSRGFDLFEDSSFLNQSNYSTHFSEQTKLFKNWIDESTEPFLSIIYNSDLETLGDEESNQAKLELFDERLGTFIRNLKENNQWENNYVLVMGLQGRSEYNRLGETSFSNLHTENVNIAFFIKPPRQKGDEGINLKIDSPATLADFGLSLMKIIDREFETKKSDDFPIWDYSNLWISNQLTGTNNPNLKPQRNILIESANTWTSNLELRFGLIYGHYIYIESKINSLFNRLNDGLETIDLEKSLPDIRANNQNQINKLRLVTNAEKWTDFQNEEYKLVELNRQYWANSGQRAQIFELEKKRLIKEKKSQPLSTLLMYYQNTKREKDLLYDEARRVSYNLSLENIWGLWNRNRNWPHPEVTTENQ